MHRDAPYSVAVSGIRDIAPDDESKAADAIRTLCGRATRFVLGGARGVDTLALIAVARWRPDAERLVIVPGTVAQQPAEAREAIRRLCGAEQVRELGGNPGNPAQLMARNRAMLDEADALLAFPDVALDLTTPYRPGEGGTAWTLKEAMRRGMPVRVVRVRRF